jgi:hypothetical protein
LAEPQPGVSPPKSLAPPSYSTTVTNDGTSSLRVDVNFRVLGVHAWHRIG